jgi:aconitate hydratase
MAPEYGATMGFFPVDAATLRYLRETGRTEEHVDLVERYCKEQGLWRNPNATHSKYSGIVELDLSTVEPCVAGPRKPHERIPLGELGRQFREQLSKPTAGGGFDVKNKASRSNTSKLKDGDIVIASITSCTNTAIPSLILGAGLMARKAVEKGLRVPAHVKTSLAPGSHVAAAYLKNTDLLTPLETLGFNIVCYGCASCIGNSGPLPEEIESAIKMDDLIVTSVLSGNRNFEGRIHALTRANYLASPPLVLAFALAGTVDIDIQNDPIGRGFDGQLVYLTDIWPTPGEIEELLDTAANPELCRQVYSNISASSEMWEKLPAENSSVFEWEENSTYIREPSFFDGIDQNTPELREIRDAAVFGFYGDFITTDHISPAGAIPADSPAADYLASHGVTPAEFNSFGCRRGNHEVMMRGTLSNIRIRNKLVTHEGGWTLYHPAQKKMTMFDAAMKYKESNTPLIVLAGKMYGAGSSRDWAAKGTFLLGVRAVIAESFERIHRSNLVEMGVLPLEFTNGETPDSLGLTGSERFSIIGATSNLTPGNRLDVEAHDPENGNVTRFKVLNRIDTPIELEYYRHGGILQYVLRKIMKGG